MFKLLKKEKTQKELFFQELRKIFPGENYLGEHKYKFNEKENGTFSALKVFLQTYDKYSGNTLECEYNQFGNNAEGCTITNKPHILFPNCVKEIDSSYNPEFPSIWSIFIFNYLGYSNGIEIHETSGIGETFPKFGFRVTGDARFLNPIMNKGLPPERYYNLNKVWIKPSCADPRISLPVQSIESRNELFMGYCDLRTNIENIFKNRNDLSISELENIAQRLEALILNYPDIAQGHVRNLNAWLTENTYENIKQLNNREHTRIKDEVEPHIIAFDTLLGKYL